MKGSQDDGERGSWGECLPSKAEISLVGHVAEEVGRL